MDKTHPKYVAKALKMFGKNLDLHARNERCVLH